MKRIVGVLGLLAILYGVVIFGYDADTSGLLIVANRQGFYGIITIGAALLIITGGIDLSIGSVVAFSAVLFADLITRGVHPYLALPIVVGVGMVIGLINGLLVTQLKLPAFLVTLCGMFVYRGLARQLAGSFGISRMREAQPDFAGALDNMKYYLVGKSDRGLEFPVQFVLMLVIAGVVAFFLHRTARGRHWYAIGYNEQAAKYAGVNVNRQKIVVYVICSALASLAGPLHLLDYSSLKADEAGNSYELQAITGAVLGGCSLRGGEGTLPGMVLGAMVVPLLNNLITLANFKNDAIPLIIGLTLLLATIVDEFVRRRSRLNR
jgi:ribose transport system permease protein